jgi:plasmid stabilization system protein ParE
MRFASVVVTERYLESAFAAFDFVAERSPTRARLLDAEAQRKVASLVDNPLRGRKVPEVDDPAYRELLIANGDYRLMYRVNESRRVVEAMLLWPARKPFEVALLLDGE